MLSLAGLALGFALVAPAPAFARMHFTTTNERLEALTQQANSSVSLTNAAEIATKLNEITTQAQAAKAAAEPSPSALPSSGQANVLGAAPSLLALGLVFVVGGLGILGAARLRRSA